MEEKKLPGKRRLIKSRVIAADGVGPVSGDVTSGKLSVEVGVIVKLIKIEKREEIVHKNANLNLQLPFFILSKLII